MAVHIASGWSGDLPDVALVVTDDEDNEVAVEHLTLLGAITLMNELVYASTTAMEFQSIINRYEGRH